MIEIKKLNGDVLMTVPSTALHGTGLYKANLSGANLKWADLSGANLKWADLSGANLKWADLSGADLSGADLSGADLAGATINKANLYKADLSGADLSGADLAGASLAGAFLHGADLQDAINVIVITPIGSRGAGLVANLHDDGPHVYAGCFSGTLDEFAAAVEKTHGDNKHGRTYRAAIALIREFFAD